MKKERCLVALLLIISTACNTGKKENLQHYDTVTQANNTTKAKPALNYKIDSSAQVTNTLLPKRDTLLTVDIKDNKGSVHGYLSGIGKHITIVVPVAGGDSITAEIIPENDTANIRFNQIYIPVGKQGKYDGPFSRKINYPITVKGNYKLIVGENLMAEGDWKGSFTCNVVIR